MISDLSMCRYSIHGRREKRKDIMSDIGKAAFLLTFFFLLAILSDVSFIYESGQTA